MLFVAGVIGGSEAERAAAHVEAVAPGTRIRPDDVGASDRILEEVGGVVMATGIVLHRVQGNRALDVLLADGQLLREAIAEAREKSPRAIAIAAVEEHDEPVGIQPNTDIGRAGVALNRGWKAVGDEPRRRPRPAHRRNANDSERRCAHRTEPRGGSDYFACPGVFRKAETAYVSATAAEWPHSVAGDGGEAGPG